MNVFKSGWRCFETGMCMLWNLSMKSRYVTRKPEVIKRRIRKGIPDALRGRVWSLLLSADTCTDIYNCIAFISFFIVAYYDNLVANHVADESSDFTRKGGVIDRDINRTFPAHETFSQLNGLGQEVLRNVLNAFADRDKEVLMYSSFYCRLNIHKE